MKFEEALKEVMKDSPPNAAIRKCDMEKAVSLVLISNETSAPAPAVPPAPPQA
jgi:hypothetical protein